MRRLKYAKVQIREGSNMQRLNYPEKTRCPRSNFVDKFKRMDIQTECIVLPSPSKTSRKKWLSQSQLPLSPEIEA